MLMFSSFRGRLALWFGCLSLVTLLSVGLYVAPVATQHMALTAGQSVHATALGAANLLGANLRERELEVALLSQAPHFVRGDLSHPDILQSLELSKKSRTEFAWLGVTDANGKVIQASGGMLQGLSVGKSPWFSEGLRRVYKGDVHEAVLLATLLPGQVSGEPLRFIDFAAPIKNKDGQVIGVIGAHGHWSWVTETVQAAVDGMGSTSDSEILIVDKRGTVLYPQSLVGLSRLPEGMTTQQSYSTLAWDDGRDYLTSQVALDTQTQNDLGWRIVVRQSLETALQPLDALRNRLVILGFFATLVCAMVALWLARGVTQPIEQLTAAAGQIERRDTAAAQYPLATGVREVAQLSQSMQSMTASLLQREHELETLNQTLEQQVQQRTAALEAANHQLAQLASRDPLTGLYNRRSLDEKLKECVHTSKRSGRSFSLLILDPDHFKRINDSYGHSTGDAVLQQLAGLLTEHIRNTDFVARYSGEEFIILLQDTLLVVEATTVAEKVRAAVEHAHFPGVGQITVSIGIGLWDPASPGSKDLFHKADEALYQAKSGGRNRVVVYAPPA